MPAAVARSTNQPNTSKPGSTPCLPVKNSLHGFTSDSYMASLHGLTWKIIVFRLYSLTLSITESKNL